MSNEVNQSKRRFLAAATGAVGAVGVGFIAYPFVAYWQPSARAQAAGAPVEVDISKIEPGQRITVEWRGKPVWIVRRTDANLQSLSNVEGSLRDIESAESIQPDYTANKARSREGHEEYLVVIGICTHLGCSPTYIKADDAHNLGADWEGGFFCPCHGSRFDLAGRVYQNVPAPTNLSIPAYQYVSETRIQIGADENGVAS